ncbi:MAG: sialate O-acetylesterase [Cocleimonas sp.]|nr:sialate O-acetylesterase [Cocleimonas sp.]
MKLKNKLLFTTLIFFSFIATHLNAKTHIYLLIGQSNMMGKSKSYRLPPAYHKTPANVSFYYQAQKRKLAQYAYFGPEVSFAHHVARAFPNDKHIIVKYVASGSYIRQWMPNQPLYKAMIRQIRYSLLPKRSKKKTLPVINSIVWMQGESDSRNKASAKRYGGRLTQFIHSLRRDLNAPNSLFIIGAVSPKNKGFPEVKQVRAQQKQVHRVVSNTHYVETNDLKTFDNTHFNASSQMELGKRFAQSYIKQYSAVFKH